MARGDHLKVWHFLYSHHAVDRGDGTVIEFGPKGTLGTVRRVSVADFSEGRPMEIVEHLDRRYSRNMIVARAQSRIGEANWNVFSNNCEHFANWCVIGDA